LGGRLVIVESAERKWQLGHAIDRFGRNPREGGDRGVDTHAHSVAQMADPGNRAALPGEGVGSPTTRRRTAPLCRDPISRSNAAVSESRITVFLADDSVL